MNETKRRQDALIEKAIEHMHEAFDLVQIVCADLCESGECDAEHCPFYYNCPTTNTYPLNFASMNHALYEWLFWDDNLAKVSVELRNRQKRRGAEA